MKEEITPEEALGLFVTGPIMLVTSAHEGKTGIMPATYIMGISTQPTLIGVSLRPKRFTLDLIRKSRQFALNVPHAGIAKHVKFCGSNSGWNVDKLPATGLHVQQGQRVAAPLVEECLASVECVVKDLIELGDHVLVVGEVLRAVVDKEAFDGGWKLRTREASPLNQVGDGVYATPCEPFKP